MTRTAKPVTSSDVARLARVSRSAVSRCFTKGASVAPQTRARVMQAAEALGYRPNAIARSLITQKSNMIGLVMADLSNPFYGTVLEVFSDKLQQLGQHVLLFSVSRAQDIDTALPALLQYQVDGVIITSATLSSEMAHKCAGAGTPVVLFNRYVDDDAISAVCTDNVAGGRAMADVLHRAGCRRPAFIAGTRNTSTSNDRQAGFYARLGELGLFEQVSEQGDYNYDGGLVAARKLLARRPRPDGIFCANDMMALAAMDVARRELGLKVPGDVAICGFDGIAQSGWVGSDLTTIEQDIGAMTDEAIAILFARIARPGLKPVRAVLSGRLIERSSCGGPGR